MQTVLLSEHTVEKSMFQCSIIVKQIDKKIRGIDSVYPLRNICCLISRCFTGNSITDHDFTDRLTAKQTDVIFFHRCDPVWHTIIINLKAQIPVNVCRMCKSQMPVNVPVKVLTVHIFHAFIQLYKLCILICHINTNICRYSF